MPGKFVTCRVGDLRPHPSCVRHQLTVSAAKLSTLAEQGDEAFRDPLIITRDHIVIDGYARLELARRQGRITLPCIEYELTDAEALLWVLRKNTPSNGLNTFTRILLSLDLEPWFREKARLNQRAGGQNQDSSKLTEAERLDVRREIAAVAGVCTGNVTKAKRLMTTAQPELLQALRSGEIRIHRAWQWSKAPPEDQVEALRLYQSKKGITKTIRNLVSQHQSKSSPAVPDLVTLGRQLSAFASGRLGPVSVHVIKAPGRAVFLTEELFRNLGSQEEVPLT